MRAQPQLRADCPVLINNLEGTYFDFTAGKIEALYFYYRVLDRANMKKKKVLFKGLDAAKRYTVSGYEGAIGGDELMSRGLYLKDA